MFSRSLYINLGANTLEDFFKTLGIPLANCWFYEDPPVDYRFYGQSENAANFAFVDGDFTHAVDVSCFDMNWITLDSKLKEMSRLGYLIAVPYEDAQSPFVYHLYKEGLRLYADIIGENYVEIFKTF